MNRWDEREERVARRAYQIWESEGRPEGRAREHWELASEEVAAEENIGTTLSSVAESMTGGPYGEPVEPAETLENEADLPALSDQDRNIGLPRRRGGRKSQ